MLDLSNGRVLEAQIRETEILTSQPPAISDVVSDDQAEILFTVPWEVLHKRGHHYCFKIIARRKTTVLHSRVGVLLKAQKFIPRPFYVSPISLP